MTVNMHSQVNMESNFVKPTKAVEIIAMGMLTSIGGNVEQTLAAIRAGISGYQESDTQNKNFKPMIMSLVPEDALPPLDEELAKISKLTSRQQRLLRLITPAIQQAVVSIENKPVALMFGGPEKIPRRRSVISDEFLKQIAIQSKVQIDLKNSYVFPHGRASGLYALEAAMLMLEQEQVQYILIGSADTYLDHYLLETLDMDDRVLAEGVMDGFAPAEGASFLLLKAASDVTRLKIFPPGIAKEEGHYYSNKPYKGEGLATAINEAISSSSMSNIETVFASFNGENMHSKEWGVSLIRNKKSFNSNINIIHPADCYGDIGAATAITLLSLAAAGISSGIYTKPALVFSSSEMEQRAAICLY